MSEFNQKKYIADYQKANYNVIKIKLHKIHDADIIEILDKQPSKQGYIKNLIRKKEQG